MKHINLYKTVNPGLTRINYASMAIALLIVVGLIYIMVTNTTMDAVNAAIDTVAIKFNSCK